MPGGGGGGVWGRPSARRAQSKHATLRPVSTGDALPKPPRSPPAPQTPPTPLPALPRPPQTPTDTQGPSGSPRAAPSRPEQVPDVYRGTPGRPPASRRRIQQCSQREVLRTHCPHSPHLEPAPPREERLEH